MAMQKGARTTATVEMLDNIIELCKSRPMSCSDIAQEFNCSYKTAWIRLKELHADGRLIVANTRNRNGEVLYSTTEQRNVPYIPGPEGQVNPLRYVYYIQETGGNQPSKLEQLDKLWPLTLCGIFRTAAIIATEDKFPADRHAEYETWLKTYRGELALRIQQVNAILQTDKFWTKEGLTDMQHDPSFRAKVILEAYDNAVRNNQPS